MAQLALVQNLVTSWHHLHCLQSWPPGCVTCIALALSVNIELVSSSARVNSVKFHKGGSLTHSVSYLETSRPIDRTPGIPGSNKNYSATCVIHRPQFQKGLVVSYLERLGPIDRTPGIPGSDKKLKVAMNKKITNTPSTRI